MAHLIAWVIVLPVALAWVAASSALWFLFAGFGWRRHAQAVGAGPIVPLQRAIRRALHEVHRGLKHLPWATLLQNSLEFLGPP